MPAYATDQDGNHPFMKELEKGDELVYAVFSVTLSKNPIKRHQNQIVIQEDDSMIPTLGTNVVGTSTKDVVEFINRSVKGVAEALDRD